MGYLSLVVFIPYTFGGVQRKHGAPWDHSNIYIERSFDYQAFNHDLHHNFEKVSSLKVLGLYTRQRRNTCRLQTIQSQRVIQRPSNDHLLSRTKRQRTRQKKLCQLCYPDPTFSLHHVQSDFGVKIRLTELPSRFNNQPARNSVFRNFPSPFISKYIASRDSKSPDTTFIAFRTLTSE